VSLLWKIEILEKKAKRGEEMEAVLYRKVWRSFAER
jgi:hypothetical protein